MIQASPVQRIGEAFPFVGVLTYLTKGPESSVPGFSPHP